MRKKYKTSKEIVYGFFFAKEPDVIKTMGLCYFAYAWGLVFLGCEIAPFRFRKTSLGPIDESLLFVTCHRTVPERHISDFLYFIWTQYGCYSGEQLMDRIKKQPPYNKATDKLSKHGIRKFFNCFKRRF